MVSCNVFIDVNSLTIWFGSMGFKGSCACSWAVSNVMNALGPSSLMLVPGYELGFEVAGGGVVTIGFVPVMFFLLRNTPLQACTLNLPFESKIPDGSAPANIWEIPPEPIDHGVNAACGLLLGSCRAEAPASPAVDPSDACRSVTCSTRSCLSLSACCSAGNSTASAACASRFSTVMAAPT